MPRVSVIVPTYNRSHLTAQAIRSVLGQTVSDFEVVVVNDGSTDDTEEIVLAFSDPRLKYFRQENQGPSVARSTGLQASTGEFIAFLDSDDLFLPNRLELQLAMLEKEPGAGLVYGRYYSTNEQEAPEKIKGACHADLGLRHLLVRGTAFHWSTVLVRRSNLDSAGGFREELTYLEDWELAVRLALDGCQMICVDEPVSIVRQQAGSHAKSAFSYLKKAPAVLDMVYDDPRMPPEMHGIRNTVYATRHVRSAAAAYQAQDMELGKEFLELALQTDPTLTDENIDLVVDQLFNRVMGFCLGDPRDTLQSVILHLPGERHFARELGRRLWAKFYIDGAFEAYQLGQTTKCRNYALQAIRKRPAYLQNRGLLAIFWRSLTGQAAS